MSQPSQAYADPGTIEVLIALQRALLGSVTPNMRGVGVRCRDRHVTVLAIYDGPIAEADLEELSCVETELIADLPDDYVVETRPERIDPPQAYPTNVVWAYRKKESGAAG